MWGRRIMSEAEPPSYRRGTGQEPAGLMAPEHHQGARGSLSGGFGGWLSYLRHGPWTNPNVTEQCNMTVTCNCNTTQGILAKVAPAIRAVTSVRRARSGGQFWLFGKPYWSSRDCKRRCYVGTCSNLFSEVNHSQTSGCYS